MELAEQITMLAPSDDSLIDFLAKDTRMPVEPFAEERMQVLAMLSQQILRDPLLRQDAASVALAYWLRRANITRLKNHLRQRLEQEPHIVAVPVGNVLHIAPANVDTLFVYSWALAFLCGNTNIVRLSTRSSGVVTRLLEHINALMLEYDVLRQHNAFVRYPHNKDLTELLSRWCQHRIIWGGDETINGLRPLALSPHASERVFGNKFSYALIAADAFLDADDATRQQLASNFFNDMFWFDQMACSSPHIVFWLGNEEQVAECVPRFNALLSQEIVQRNYTPAMADVVRRLSFAFETASSHNVQVQLQQPGFLSMLALDYASLRKEVCGGGLLTHVQVDTLWLVAELAQQEDQTITHFGLLQADLYSLARLVGVRGVDRLVPIGEALAFSSDWDGYDLLNDLVRRVVVRV